MKARWLLFAGMMDTALQDQQDADGQWPTQAKVSEHGLPGTGLNAGCPYENMPA